MKPPDCKRNRLLAATLVHFTVDFYSGLTIPLPEPTLLDHFQTSLPVIALLLGGSALLANVVQPIAGALLPKHGAPWLMLWTPALAAAISCLGISDQLPVGIVLLLTASLAIGIVHPEVAMAAHALSGRHQGLGVSMLMSGGYFGFATGSLVSGIWVAHHEPGLQRFWILGIPALLTMGVVWWTGLHRLSAHSSTPAYSKKSSDLPFAVVMPLCVCIASSMCVIARLVSILLVRRFPLADGQGWGGATVFASGISGALASLFWGYVSERIGRGRVIFLTQLLAIPFVVGILTIKEPWIAPLFGIGIGATMGGVFPLSVVLARQSSGLSARLRMGLCIGGAWGLGELFFIMIGRYIGKFEGTPVAPVVQGMNTTWFLMAGTAVLALWIARHEQKIGADDYQRQQHPVP